MLFSYLVAFLCGCFLPSCALRVDKQGLKEPSVQLFVLNLDHRKDRCLCASYQLGSTQVEQGFTSFPATRMSAANPSTYMQQCPEMSHAGKVSHSAAPALVCSNYKVWKSLDANPATDFAIVYEDDLNIVSKDYWGKVKEFVSKAANQDWDIVFVDPKNNMKAVGEDHMQILKAGDAASNGLSGSHMMIIRTVSATKLIALANNEYAPMDKFVKNMVRAGVKVGLWTPGIIQQYSARTGLSNRAHQQFPVNEFCSKSSVKSDIKKLQKNSNPEHFNNLLMAFECK